MNDDNSSKQVSEQDFKVAMMILICGAVLTFGFLILMIMPAVPDVIRMIAGLAGIIVCGGACVLSKRIMGYE